MSESESAYVTTPIEPADIKTGFSCGKRALDDYFARRAAPNDLAGIGRAYVLRRGPDDDVALPTVLGFYTLSMANAESAQVAKVVEKKLPKYAMPVALIGRNVLAHQRQHLATALRRQRVRILLGIRRMLGGVEHLHAGERVGQLVLVCERLADHPED
jgi:hypothetical protein